MPRKKTKAEKKALRATHKARRLEEMHRQLEGRAVAVIDAMSRELAMLRETQERFRHVLFGAFLGRALGDEPKLSDAYLAERAEWFKGKEAEPWMLFSAQ